MAAGRSGAARGLGIPGAVGGIGIPPADGGLGMPGTEGGLGIPWDAGGVSTNLVKGEGGAERGTGLGGRLIIAFSRGDAGTGVPSLRFGRTIRTVSFFGSDIFCCGWVENSEDLSCTFSQIARRLSMHPRKKINVGEIILLPHVILSQVKK